MAIELFVEPRKTYTWKEFKENFGSHSIALDGFVDDKTIEDDRGPYANYDHHSKSPRSATLSTCMQVNEAINMGLFDTFRVDGIPHANIYINDPDEDTCLSWWQIQRHELVRGHGTPRINRVVAIEDKMDRHAGAYPLGDTKLRRQMAWIFAPYNNVRFSGELATMGEDGMRNVVEAVCSRVSKHVFDEGEELSLEGQYERIGGGPGWAFVKETGAASRIAIYNDNIVAGVRLVAEKEDGSYVYSYWRNSKWTPFSVPKLYRILNKLEGGVVTETNKHGGSDTVGGSPRETGSFVPPTELEKVINEKLCGI